MMRLFDLALVLLILTVSEGFRPLWTPKSSLSSMLNFKSSVEDKPALVQPQQAGLTFRIKEAAFHDLSSVIMLRLMVFYPTVKTKNTCTCTSFRSFITCFVYFSYAQTNYSKQDSWISSAKDSNKDRHAFWR